MKVIFTQKNDLTKEKIHSEVENINYCSEEGLVTVTTASGKVFRYNLSIWNMEASAK